MSRCSAAHKQRDARATQLSFVSVHAMDLSGAVDALRTITEANELSTSLKKAALELITALEAAEVRRRPVDVY